MRDPEESCPPFNHPEIENNEKPPVNDQPIPAPQPPLTPSVAVSKPSPTSPVAVAKPKADWTAEGLPLSNGSVVGEPLPRQQWDSSLFSCLGRNDEFCSSDLEVCILGSFAPCVLYGSNVERLGSGPGSFANSCLFYAGLYMLGNSIVGWNCFAPWLSCPSRTAIRHKFNLKGSWEAFARSSGCSGFTGDEARLEKMEVACDVATHFFCHPCSLCQEGRELRRRLPHPGFNGRSLVVMMPPGEQTMARDHM